MQPDKVRQINSVSEEETEQDSSTNQFRTGISR